MKVCGLALAVGLGIACIGGTGAVTLISPPDADTVSGDELSLSWSTVESATHYRLEISRDESFSTLAVDADSITGTSYVVDLSYQTSPLDGQATYYWHVSAYAEGWGSWSDARSFYNENRKRL